MSLQAQLAGAQSAGDRDAQNRLKVLGGAQDRALQSIMGAGDLAGNLQSQDFQRQSTIADARDRINQFNVNNARDIQSRNVNARNSAASQNLSNAQNLMNANTEMANSEQQFNKSLAQQAFENNMQKNASISNAYTNQATQASNNAARQNQALGSLGSALGQAAAGVQSQSNWDKLFASKK
jgi:hypothetical protein